MKGDERCFSKKKKKRGVDERESVSLFFFFFPQMETKKKRSLNISPLFFFFSCFIQPIPQQAWTKDGVFLGLT